MTKTSTKKDTKMLTVNIPADMLDRFKAECKTDNLTMSEAIKGFIQSYLDGNLEAMQTGMIGNNTTAKQIEEAVERKIDDYISNEIDQVVTRHLETDLDVKLDSILEKKLDKYLDNKLESRLKAKLDNNLENNTDNNLDTNLEHNLEFDTDNNLDEKLEPQAQETIEDDTDNNLDSNLEVTSTTLQNNEPPTTEDEGSAIAQTETPEKQLANDDRLLNAIARYLPAKKLKPLADCFLELLKEYGIEEDSFKFQNRAESRQIKEFLRLEGKSRPKEGSKYRRVADILLEAYEIAKDRKF